MNAFGKRNSLSGGQRPSFGVAKPMKGGPGGSSAPAPDGGDQFPPLDELAPAESDFSEGSAPTGGAMDRLTARQNASGEQGNSRAEGFEARPNSGSTVMK